jgi:hypothetical protein
VWYLVADAAVLFARCEQQWKAVAKVAFASILAVTLAIGIAGALGLLLLPSPIRPNGLKAGARVGSGVVLSIVTARLLGVYTPLAALVLVVGISTWRKARIAALHWAVVTLLFTEAFRICCELAPILEILAALTRVGNAIFALMVVPVATASLGQLLRYPSSLNSAQVPNNWSFGRHGVLALGACVALGFGTGTLTHFTRTVPACVAMRAAGPSMLLPLPCDARDHNTCAPRARAMPEYVVGDGAVVSPKGFSCTMLDVCSLERGSDAHMPIAIRGSSRQRPLQWRELYPLLYRASPRLSDAERLGDDKAVYRTPRLARFTLLGQQPRCVGFWPWRRCFDTLGGVDLVVSNRATFPAEHRLVHITGGAPIVCDDQECSPLPDFAALGNWAKDIDRTLVSAEPRLDVSTVFSALGVLAAHRVAINVVSDPPFRKVDELDRTLAHRDFGLERELGSLWGDTIESLERPSVSPQRYPSVRIDMRTPRVVGPLPSEVVRRIVRQNYGRFWSCYQADLARHPGVSGRVVVEFVIGREGNVTSTASHGSSLRDGAMVQCVQDAFGQMSFPWPEGSVVSVVFPLDFRLADKDVSPVVSPTVGGGQSARGP